MLYDFYLFYLRTLSQHRHQNERQSIVTRRNDPNDNLLIAQVKGLTMLLFTNYIFLLLYVVILLQIHF